MYGGAALFQAQEGDGLKHKLSVCNDVRYVYYQFAQLLQKAGMIMSNDYIIGLSGTHIIGFIPTNEAISTSIAAGKIPGMNAAGTVTNSLELRQYLLSYFLSDRENAIITYPYPNKELS